MGVYKPSLRATSSKPLSLLNLPQKKRVLLALILNLSDTCPPVWDHRLPRGPQH
jgi:hypothetical protein